MDDGKMKRQKDRKRDKTERWKEEDIERQKKR